MQANDRGIEQAGRLRALGVILCALMTAGEAMGVDDLQVDEAVVDVAVQARASAEDLADSLRSLESTLQTTDSSAQRSGGFTAADNDALIEAAAKAQLSGIAGELDLLAAMLAAGADSEETAPLLRSLTKRAAILGGLGQRTSQPLMSATQQQALMQLWRDVELLSRSSSTVATPAADPEVEVSN